MPFLFLFATIVFYLFGSLQQSPLMISYAQLALSIFFLTKNYLDNPARFIDPCTLFALMMSITSMIHIAAFSLEEYSTLIPYFNYASFPHFMIAVEILYFGSLFLLIGMKLSINNPAFGFLPKIHYQLPDTFSFFRYTIFLMVLSALSRWNYVPSLGSLSSFIQLLPLISIFFMARKGSAENKPALLNLALTLVIYLTFFAVLYSYLRAEMLLPTFAYFLGVTVGRSSLTALIKLKYLPIYIFIGIFYSYFQIFGDTRENLTYGTDRVNELIKIKEDEGIYEEQIDEVEKTPFTRLSLINQLSQIGRVVEEDEFYEGKTIEYLAFAFIPRFLWPEKPIIATGAWYAFRIGQGRLVDGRYTNSINMTVPGELYLNFGWFGIVIGCTLFGMFIGALWESTEFWKSHNNFMGTLFSLFLLYIAIGQMGADLQVVVTYIAYYLILLLLSRIAKFTTISPQPR